MSEDSSEPILTPRARRRIATTERIIDTALEIITQEGIEALTIQRIAGQLDYAVGALYRYFASKDELLVAAQRRVIEGLHSDIQHGEERIASYLARAAVTAEVASLLRLMMAGQIYARLEQEQPAQFRLITMILSDPRPLADDEVVRNQLLPALLGLLAHVAELFSQAVQVEAIAEGPAARRTVTLWASVQGIVQLRKLGRFAIPGLDPDALVGFAIDSLLLGFGASPSNVDDARRRCARLARSAT